MSNKPQYSQNSSRRGGCFGRIIRFIVKTVIVFWAFYGVMAHFFPTTQRALDNVMSDTGRIISQTVASVTSGSSRTSRNNETSVDTGEKQSTADVTVDNVPIQPSASEESSMTSATASSDKATAIVKPTATPKPTATLKPTAAPTTEPAWEDLRNGSKGDAVKEVQQRLKDLNYLTGTVDGSYGKGTESAVKAFQKAAGLEQTGVANQKTYDALFRSNAPQAPSQSDIRKEVKDFIDGYEKFIDDYIDFMEHADSNSITYAIKYTQMLADYAKWADKIDDYDESELTDAELKYYTEALLRIDAKLYAAALK